MGNHHFLQRRWEQVIQHCLYLSWLDSVGENEVGSQFDVIMVLILDAGDGFCGRSTTTKKKNVAGSRGSKDGLIYGKVFEVSIF